MKDIVMGGGYP